MGFTYVLNVFVSLFGFMSVSEWILFLIVLGGSHHELLWSQSDQAKDTKWGNFKCLYGDNSRKGQ